MRRRITNHESRITNTLLLLILASCFLIPDSVFAQSVDLLSQGDGYTPPFYQGRTLWSSQSRVTLRAIPQGLGNPSNLNYKWTKNGTVLGSISGVGKSTLSFMDSILSRSQNIKVEIIAGSGAVLAESSTTLNPTQPSLLVYENNPLYGFMLHRGVSGNYKLNSPEITFAAFPLFFSTNSRTDNLNYEWQTNDGTRETKNAVTYRIPEGGKGASQVTLHVSNQDKILQDVSESFLVQFGATNE